VGPVENGHFEVRVVDGGGHVQRATGTLDRAGRLIVVGTDGDWKGRVVLTR
jgi:hypothetical protein